MPGKGGGKGEKEEESEEEKGAGHPNGGLFWAKFSSKNSLSRVRLFKKL